METHKLYFQFHNVLEHSDLKDRRYKQKVDSEAKAI